MSICIISIQFSTCMLGYESKTELELCTQSKTYVSPPL